MNISERTYKLDEVITFRKTTERFGGLSNMSAGFSLFVNEINIANTEMLYQACRFPLFPNIQEKILLETNPMKVKWISRKYLSCTRQDWDEIKFKVMKWCLHVKYIQNLHSFSRLLYETENKPIVEYSQKDNIWGAIPIKKDLLQGKNVLGRLLMDLRQKYIFENMESEFVEPLNIPAFLLFNNPIKKVYYSDYSIFDLDEVYDCSTIANRTQTHNPKNDTWVKRYTNTGRFTNVKSDGTPFKGVAKEVDDRRK